MNGGFAISSNATSVVCPPRIQSNCRQRCLSSSCNIGFRRGTGTRLQPFFLLDPKSGYNCRGEISGFDFRCNNITNPSGTPGPEENETKAVLDAFFLGKALAEALSERVESTVGEFLSAIGRLQAEQQKQVQDFQEEVLERAKRAKEKAAREAMEAQGLIPRSSIADEPKDQRNGVASHPTVSNSSSSSVQPATIYPGSIDVDPPSGVSDED